MAEQRPAAGTLRPGEIARLRAQRDRLLGACRNVLETWWDRVYPEDVFDGSSGDEGALEVVRIRKMLRAAIAEARDEGEE